MSNNGRIRIISGQWRRRQIRFAGSDDLRPTPDAVRETLFNWLRNVVCRATCLDLFAGSGALGFEAASRGAGSVVLVEKNRRSFASLQENIRLLHAGEIIEAYNAEALSYLQGCTDQFSVIFLDPPYTSNLLSATVRMIAARKIVQPGGYIYLENSKISAQTPAVPEDWNMIRSMNRGNVSGLLYQTASPVHNQAEPCRGNPD